ncbi:phenylalanine 4-monooxygenase [Comamonas thiooxydans]|uniref:Phenylalanine-4-hydroxylase n=1 Tax=Comamonas thiooxydans TaxID=363952 RepID=A0A0E3CG56_9BURK|nr:phenylalanine 4-monooxygenase [Comamonas thiooxydans]KGH21125.1 phenylalanine 4-monooxygenase [Comamonas thiooxydans]KGH24533.1 phenylalanine 4-monooxygenase [Comamonas thiooxydans]
MGAAPVVYGQSDRPPRGDYTRAHADYTCTQDYSAYTEAEHDTYHRLYERQSALLPGRASQHFIDALPSLGAKERIPRFEEINERLFKATGWEIVGVPGLIPEVPFFSLLAQRKFPVTDWIRKPEEFEYIVEPDIFHDLFGHVPLLFNPVMADFIQAYGQGGLKAAELGACEMLSRLYWYTVEFGLIRESGGVRAYGAGILSSVGELEYSVNSPQPHRLPLQLERTMRTLYKIDTYQQTYFVIDDMPHLLNLADTDFAPLYEQLRQRPTIGAKELLPGEQLI